MATTVWRRMNDLLRLLLLANLGFRHLIGERVRRGVPFLLLLALLTLEFLHHLHGLLELVLEALRLLRRAKLDAHVHKRGADVSVGAVHGGEDPGLLAAGVLLDLGAGHDEEVGAHLEGLLAPHQHADLLAVLVLQDLDGTEAALLPLTLGESVRLGLGLEEDVLVLLAARGLDLLELDDGNEFGLALGLGGSGCGGVVVARGGIIAARGGSLGGGGERAGIEGCRGAETAGGAEPEDGRGGSLLLLLLGLYGEERGAERKSGRVRGTGRASRAFKGEKDARAQPPDFRRRAGSAIGDAGGAEDGGGEMTHRLGLFLGGHGVFCWV